MRIMILANSDVGLYKFRRELIEELSSAPDNEVMMALPDGEHIESLKKAGADFIPFEFNRRGMNPLADLNQISRYRRLLKKYKPDVVLTYTIKPNVYGGIASHSCRIPCIANVTGLGTSIENGGLLSLITTTLYRIGLRTASCVFFQNRSNKEFFERKKIVSGKTALIPGSGVNLSEHGFEPYPSVDGGVRFLFVGRVMKDKGINELLDAMKKISTEYDDVSLDIAGWCEEDYTDVLKTAEATGRIRYLGQQSEMHALYKNCHCVILPSYHEGCANAMLEASSTGRPVITTTVPGCLETFDEGVTGFGCEAGSADSLADAMKRFLRLSFDEKASMGAAARSKMEREFDRNIVVSQYIKAINQTMK